MNPLVTAAFVVSLGALLVLPIVMIVYSVLSQAVSAIPQ